MKKRKLNKKKLILFLMTIIFLNMFIISVFKITNYLLDNRNNRQIQKIVSEAITIEPINNVEEKYIVDFNKLKEKNSNTVAYLKVNNTNIDYVVVKGTNNEFYLNHNFNKEANVSGWIFADYRNKFDGSDKNIVIYGHNTHDGSMFGTLKNVLEDDWYQNKENHVITLITNYEHQKYEIFSVYTITAEDYYINTDFKDDEGFETFIKTLKFRSIYQYEYNISKEDKLLTLSTCTSDGKKRVVVHAKLIKTNND